MTNQPVTEPTQPARKPSRQNSQWATGKSRPRLTKTWGEPKGYARGALTKRS